MCQALIPQNPHSDAQIWGFVLSIEGELRKVARGVLRHGRPDGRTLADLDDLIGDLRVGLVHKLRRGLAPEGLDDPLAWWRTVTRNLARDLSRRRAPALDRSKSPWDLDQLGLTTAWHTDPPAAIDLRRELEARERTLDLAAPHQRLVAVLLGGEALADADLRALVEEASGLARSPAESLSGIAAWRGRHGARPRTRGARAELAFWLFSDDKRSPEAWAQAEPLAAARARDLLRKWESRARSSRAASP